MNQTKIRTPLLILGVALVLVLVYFLWKKYSSSHPNKHEVEAYIAKNFPEIKSNYGDKCVNCLEEKIVAMWSNKEYSDFKSSTKDEQKQYLLAVLSFNCKDICAMTPPPVVTLDPNTVLKWLTVHLPGASKECYMCMVKFIVKNWSVDDFAKLDGMNAEDQAATLQALIGFSCDVCQSHEKPQELIRADVYGYLEDRFFKGMKSDCLDCLTDAAMKILDLAKFVQFKNESGEISDEQKTFIYNLAQSCSNVAACADAN